MCVFGVTEGVAFGVCSCWGRRVGGVRCVCVGVREWVAFGVCVLR